MGRLGWTHSLQVLLKPGQGLQESTLLGVLLLLFAHVAANRETVFDTYVVYISALRLSLLLVTNGRLPEYRLI